MKGVLFMLPNSMMQTLMPHFLPSISKRTDVLSEKKVARNCK